jgi:TP901 family phage tail tape measure protein
MAEKANIDLLIRATQKGFDTVIKKFEQLNTLLKETRSQASVDTFSKMNQGLKALDGSISTLNSNLTKFQSNLSTLTSSFQKSEQAAGSMLSRLSMQWNLKSMIHDMKEMVAIQLRWYAVQPIATAMQAVLYAPAQMVKTGFEHMTEIENYTGMINRYAAMEGKASVETQKMTEELIQQARVMSTQLPLSFDKIMISVDRLMAAGLGFDDVKASMESFTKLQVAFPEIEMEKFTTSMVGFLNAYRDQPGFKEMANDADRLAVILDKVAMMLAKSVLAPKDTTAVIQYLGQIGSVSGFTVDQLLAMAALITNLGSKANVSARALRGFLQTLTTEKAEQGLRKLGIELDNNKTIAQQFDTVMTQLQEKLGTGQLTRGAMAALTGITSTERLNPLIGLIQHWEKYKEAVEASENSTGAVDRASAEMSNTLGGMLERFKNLWKEISTTTTQAGFLKDSIEGLIVISQYLGFIILSLMNVFMGFVHILKTVVNIVYTVIDAFSTLFTLWSKFKSGTLSLDEVKSEWDKFKQRVVDTNKALEDSRKGYIDFGAKTMEILFGPASNTKELKSKYVKKEGKADKTVDVGDDAELKGRQKALSAEAAMEQRAATLLLQMQKEWDKKERNEIENQHKMSLISDAEYYAKKEEQIRGDVEEEVKVVEDGYKEIELTLQNKLANEKDVTKQSTIQKQIEANELKKKAEITKIIVKGEIDLDNLKTSKYLDNVKERINAATHELNVRKQLISIERSGADFTSSELDKRNEDTFDRGIINASKYYDNKVSLAQANYKNELSFLDKETEGQVRLLEIKMNAAGENKDKQDEIFRELDTLENDYLAKRLTANQKFASAVSSVTMSRVKDASAIFTDTFDGSWESFWKALQSSSDVGLYDLRKKHLDWGTQINGIYSDLAGNMSSSFSSLFSDALKGDMKNFLSYWTDFCDSMMEAFSKRLSDMLVAWILTSDKMEGAGSIGGGSSLISTIMGLFSSGGSASSTAALNTGSMVGGVFQAGMANALGNIFSGGRVVPFAKGGIVMNPTFFPMANGTGLMGEAGPEAVIPLKRNSDGKLGVSSEGGGHAPINVNIANIVSPDMMDAYLSSPRGKGAMLNVINNNAENVRRILRS